MARDLFWAVDGAMVEGALAAEYRCLEASITAARQFALASRPSLDGLKPRERAVELAVQRLLRAPPGEVRSVYADAPPAR